MENWSGDTFFYHIYPLGMCGAPKQNDFGSLAVARLEQLYSWLDHIQDLGVGAIYLGPVFESGSHGYDTVDYYQVDRRLGTNETLSRLSAEIHRRGMRLVLDAVFNHTGRDFQAFRDLRQYGQRSAYCDWFHNLRFDRQSPYNDPFSYEGWNGYYSLVKLNLNNPAVREHLFGAVRSWVDQFEIDGLRLDAADCMDAGFLADLAGFGKSLRSDFWLVGEVVHGDYRRWANPQMLDSVTNYECYKGLFSSHNDRNYFEIAYALNRQFGEGGLYRGLPLYNFADNHDVNRVASSLEQPGHLFPLYVLLFTMPGVPSIYYGSEWGIEGTRTNKDDSALRPALEPDHFNGSPSSLRLAGWIRRLAQIRKNSPALRRGSYRELLVSHEQLAFQRVSPEQQVVIVINAAAEPARLKLQVPLLTAGTLEDLLQTGERFAVRNGQLQVDIPPCGARILAPI